MKRSGHTLIEWLLYVGLASFVTGMLAAMLVLTVQLRAKAGAITEVEEQGRHAQRLFASMTRAAASVVSPSAGATGTRLVLGSDDPAKDPTVIELVGTAIRVTEGAGGPVDVVSDVVEVSDLSFEVFSATGTPGNVRLRFTASRKNPEDRWEFDYAKTFITTAALR